MANPRDLKRFYDEFNWVGSGEQWADEWGGTKMQWHGTILPRIQMFLPVERAVEIGSGRGRLSFHLLQHCKSLALTDLSDHCVRHLRNRFGDQEHVSCHQTDGTDLGDFAPHSIDFIFSFFSLVHADLDTLSKLLRDVAIKLSPNGIFFLHHSNAAEYRDEDPEIVRFLEDYRELSISAKIVADLSEDVGLSCSSQEVFDWGGHGLFTDCFSVISKKYSRHNFSNRFFYNVHFAEERQNLSRLSKLYDLTGRSP